MGRPNKSVVGLSREEKMMMCIGDIIQVCTQTAAVLGACTGFTVFWNAIKININGSLENIMTKMKRIQDRAFSQ